MNISFTEPILSGVMHVYGPRGARLYNFWSLCETLILSSGSEIGNETSKFVPTRHFDTIRLSTGQIPAKIIPITAFQALNGPGIAFA